VNAKGHRFKIQKDMVGYFFGRREGIEQDSRDPTPNWSIPPPHPLRNKASLLQIQDVSFKYSSESPLVLEGVTLNIEMGEKVGIVGENGGGKTTLAGLMAGILVPVSGTIIHHSSAKVYTTYLPLSFLSLSLSLSLSLCFSTLSLSLSTLSLSIYSLSISLPLYLYIFVIKLPR
jgi:ABC-type glutathione transport system ATPase component